MRIALFAGSFDPFTRGHVAIVESALRLFDRVVIGVGYNINKRGLLSVEQRCQLISDYYKGDNRIEVGCYQGMTGEYAESIGATALIRGLRNGSDLEFERTVESVNRALYPGLQSVMILPPAELQHISSSVVRELMHFGKGVDSLMPEGIDINKYIK
ncbi:MAG: pantetheine-phosphate adenylyltransferase [Rikenellaceae bacterium]